MRPVPPPQLERGRILAGRLASTADDGFNGFFQVWFRSVRLAVMASDGIVDGWEHVSVSTAARTPTWEEMCFIKGLCWGEEEAVIQYHPRRSQYRDCHPFCLHLWRPMGVEFPEPNPDAVAPAGLTMRAR